MVQSEGLYWCELVITNVQSLTLIKMAQVSVHVMHISIYGLRRTYCLHRGYTHFATVSEDTQVTGNVV